MLSEAKLRDVACFIIGHKAKDKICIRCKQEFGVPKYENPPPPPIKHSQKREFKKIFIIVEKDDYDKRWGHWVEFGIETPLEYYKLKEYVISSGRLAEFSLQDKHHKSQ